MNNKKETKAKEIRSRVKIGKISVKIYFLNITLYLFLIFFLINYFSMLGFANDGLFSNERLVNFTLRYTIRPKGSYGILKITTNKLPLNFTNQIVFNSIPKEYKLIVNSSDLEIQKEFSTLVKIKALPIANETVKLKDVIINNSLTSNETVCYNDLCGEKYDVLNYIATEFIDDDAFKTVCKLNHFVHNLITYDKNLVKDQNPTVVRIFATRRGVCIHYATLLNELLKSIHLKSRIVYGVAKSYENSTDWQPHAWNEVWLNKWIPFDPTFDYCGFADTLRVRISNEPLKTLVHFSGLGDIEFNDEIIIEEINRSESQFRFNLSYELRPLKSKISLDSDQIIFVSIKNNDPYYAYTQIKFTTTKLMEIVNDTRFVVLAPYEKHIIPVWLKNNISKEEIKPYTFYTTIFAFYDSWLNYNSTGFIIEPEGEKINTSKYLTHHKELNFSIECNGNYVYYSNEFRIHQKDSYCVIKNYGKRIIDYVRIFLELDNDQKNFFNQSVILGVDDVAIVNFSSFNLSEIIKRYHLKELRLKIKLMNYTKSLIYKVKVFKPKIVFDKECIYLTNLSNNTRVSFIIENSFLNKSKICKDDLINLLKPIDNLNITILIKTTNPSADKKIKYQLKLNLFDKLKSIWLVTKDVFREILKFIQELKK